MDLTPSKTSPPGRAAASPSALVGYTFSADIPINNLQADTGGQDFVANLVTFTISGKVTVGGQRAAGRDSSHFWHRLIHHYHCQWAYTLANVPYGTTGNLTPSLASYTFTPTSLPISSLAGDLSGKNFTADQSSTSPVR